MGVIAFLMFVVLFFWAIAIGMDVYKDRKKSEKKIYLKYRWKIVRFITVTGIFLVVFNVLGTYRPRVEANPRGVNPSMSTEGAPAFKNPVTGLDRERDALKKTDDQTKKSHDNFNK